MRIENAGGESRLGTAGESTAGRMRTQLPTPPSHPAIERSNAGGLTPLTDEQREIVELARRFARDELAPHAAEWDREAGVQPDEVGERERTHRVVHAEPHHRVDRFHRADSFHEAVHRLVDHRHEDPVRHEAGEIIHLDRRLSHGAAPLHGATRRLVRRREPANDLD